jgi:hypothetical protein
MRKFAAIQSSRSARSNPWADDRRSTTHLPSRQELNAARQARQHSSIQPDGDHDHVKVKEEPVDDNSIFFDEDLSQPTSRSSTLAPRSSSDDGNLSDGEGSSTFDRSTPGDSGYDSAEPPGPPNIPAVHRVPEFCTCPIDLDCHSKEEHLIDCRTLTIEWKKWSARGVNTEK